TFERCGNDAIVVRHTSAPVLEDNTIENPAGSGIHFVDQAAGTARGNRCNGGQMGILVAGQANPTLLGNTCSGLREAAVRFEGQSRGLVQGNTCRDSSIGLEVCDDAQPTLRGNIILANGRNTALPKGMSDQPLSTHLPATVGQPRHLARSVWVSGEMPHRTIGIGYALMFGSFLVGSWLAGIVLMTGGIIVAASLLGLSQRRAQLDQGLVIKGRVTLVDKGRLTVTYTDPYGKRWTHRATRIPAQELEHYPIGSTVDVLIDPQHPGMAVLPELSDVEFSPLKPAPDHRPPSLPRRSDHALPPPRDAVVQVDLLPTLQPRLLRGLLQLARAAQPVSLGTLLVTPEALLIEPLNAGPVQELRWEAPFVVHLSVWMISAEMAELNISLRARDQGQDSTPILFKTELPQVHLDGSLEVQQRVAPYIHPQDLGRIWPWFVHYAQLHGQDISGRCVLDTPTQADHTP
ncbi:MAG: right-handed parallel beta-helix repeat-containing protein, partial [Myxococcota bacterium]